MSYIACGSDSYIACGSYIAYAMIFALRASYG